MTPVVVTTMVLVCALVAYAAGERVGRKLQERDRRAHEAAALSSQRVAREISGRIRRHADMQPVLHEAVVGLGEALSLDRVLVQLVRGQHLEPVKQWWAAELSGLSLDDPRLADCLDAATVELLTTGRSVVVDDVGRDSTDALGPSRGVAVVSAARSMVATPVVSGGELLGVVTSVSSGRSRAFSGPDVQLLESVAWSLGRALQNRQIEEQQMVLLEQLRELDRSKSEFVSSVSHELRTPLTSIVGYLEMLREGDGGAITDEQEEMLEIIGRNTARLQSLIENLLTLGRIEGGAMQLALEPVDLREVLADLPAAMAPLAHTAGLRLEVHPVPTGAVVAGDAAKLEQVVLNLLSNAMKFTPAGGVVTIRVEVQADTVSVEVADTGIGIPREEQGNLFDRFFRASNATARQTQGAGLGLSIVEGLVQAHHGAILIESEEHRGTKVSVRLPRSGPRKAVSVGGTTEQTGAPARL